ncbi:CocE/NonD family hydrolase [Cognatiyoonia sp. IB215446]|uniref:CocE/NonD family hydrolase n=1 Tax=Cognatiyoonia sp. IB215446 TaxID=3097355 RepID=UPI002A106E31|nr:CocE/NonD family hydrolase [Cognatiyoonia sp. IB215446]MDX8350647.1 CocE/NonD family hydrolase [Cognatiyoonia sp. IB215446]
MTRSMMTALKAIMITVPLAISSTSIIAEPLEIRVEMRDGTELSTLVYLPDGDGPFPTLVARTIYGPPIIPIGGELYDSSMKLTDFVPSEDDDDDDAAITAGWPLITENGYALVIQNTRGRNGSDGVDRSWRDDGEDGYDLIEWVNAQDWSNGRIGLFGDSAVGVSAALAAAEQPPALDALFLQTTPADPFGTDMAPRDGALRTESLLVQGGFLAFDVSESHIAGRGIDGEEVADLVPAIGGYVQGLFEGLEDPLNSDTWLAAPLGDVPELDQLMPFWSMLSDVSARETFRDETNALGKIEVPTSVVTLWQDTFAQSTFDLFADLEERDIPRELLVVNGTHYDIDDPRIFPEPRMLSWFDHWLKDEPRADRPVVKAATQGNAEFVEGSEVIDIIGVAERYYIAEGELVQTASESSNTFTSDPANPVPTQGGRYLLAASGALDQTDLITRQDTLVFKAAALSETRILAGPVTGQIVATSNAPSFDLSVRLLDVAPDGTASIILSDHLRIENEAKTPVTVPFDMSLIRHQLNAGHRVAIMVAGSDFPAWDRNPQTGASIFESADLQAAEITVISDANGQSYIELPFVEN